MKNFKLQLTVFLFIIFQINHLQAQIQKGALTENMTVSSEISPGEKHQYTVKLDKDQFAFFKLLQKGVDVIITTYDANGEKIEDFDSPNGKNGPEMITLTSSNKGKYIIEVSPIDKNEPRGNYELHIEKIKLKAVTLNQKVDELFTVWNSDENPGAAVAVVKDGAIIYKKGYGMANLEYSIPITPSTVFHIASVSKQFTVFSILLLEKEGKLSLDDDIRKYIPEVPDFGKTITLRHLATHTSGLRDQWSLLNLAGWRYDDVITKEHILKIISKQKELNFNPGEEFLYCNTGFTLLAEVVARVSGKTFSEFTEANIFKPLKMSRTLFYDDHEKIVKNRAYSYHTDKTGYKKSVLNYANVGATSLFTTVEDLSLWTLNFSSAKIGDVTLFNKMNTLAILNNGKTFGGALGQFVGKYKGLNEIQHGGADAGYRSYLTRFPDEKFSVIVFSNIADFNSGKMAHKIVDLYLHDKIKVEEKNVKTTTDEIVIDKNILNTYVGDYELQPGLIVSITIENGQLFALPTGQSIVKLKPLSATEFKVEGVDASFAFIPTSDGKISSAKLSQGGQIMNAPRISPFDAATVTLSNFVGRFYSEELSTEYNFVEEGGKLILKHSRLSDVELNPTKKDVFTGSVGQTEFIRDSNNVIIGCKVSTGRVQNLWFKKLL
ncbi:serine hydrolase [Flavobacterium gawalongense]|uniref:Serine hydrolase n=1 Tax=Flavobacterium gawalongense TaxID=2594432 RepID=A0A553BAQ1_9FLAO|nr:serine hydrolase [Flavobacterium gawalongense]TRX01926.1 serine hydrolase [Flavobacterium gawalongense]TRX04028.1 serine hydrolase [Flavobacterium gawalongense]TRX05324.1 serine hydrolase [Flavobacterium gawalongense]TRX06211.1 serine hydrolase [Flavobacterium gawalongense]TRX21904.1 serine hydrolase [Flavobacterium gawalongense]